MNLPNKLTLTRIILVPVFMIFVSLTSLDGIVDGNFNATFYLLAGIVFAAASFTDYLDGHLARKWHMVTDFGKFADPLADKLLTTVAFICMLRDGVCSPVCCASFWPASLRCPVCAWWLPVPRTARSSPPICGARSRPCCRC